ncbi:GNAT family N-acetyltransferase [Herbivorax sp. ANBcel31]|uniref:GNAT family N-acetyltransferase n=1 Tax=Herbivorax sp. ANBcel31 TaxID=3069754 RepID=UPI0027B54A36|nr:GNAT family N-acetyltransferase [Herbivorax sp. ANBcel31]MDQ2085937.1 GNAT family N-acetyltransferase [Herbivorax sp. ANBcel31]
MFFLNTNSDEIYFKNVELNQLIKIHKWYNNIGEYRFATGVDIPITFDDMLRKYFNIMSSSEEFFVGIYNVLDNMVGLLKGRVIFKEKVVWIKTLMVGTEFRGKGYGKKTVNLLLDYLIKKTDVKKIYLTVAKENKRACDFWKKQGFEEVENHINSNEKKIKLLFLCKNIQKVY